MSTIVVMPGGFHPFHAGHASLYQSALQTFPGADVYVAASDDTSERPFPFAIKEKLAKVAGVKNGQFVQVRSPFRPQEITSKYNPDSDVLIFVRSEKDRNEQPKPGGTKKDGSPAYFQPYTGKDLKPFGQHAYIEYLPTVEFGPGITSASEIRAMWPKLNEKRKTAMVMSLYPATQSNPALAANVVKLLDAGMGVDVNLQEVFDTKASTATSQWDTSDPDMIKFNFTASNGVRYQLDFLEPYIGPDEMSPYDYSDSDEVYENSKFVSFEQVTQDMKGGYPVVKQGIEGTGAAAEVFGIVVNAIVQYVKKFKPSLLYFQAAEPGRRALYTRMIKRVLPSLPGWTSQTNGGGEFGVYNTKKVKNAMPVQEKMKMGATTEPIEEDKETDPIVDATMKFYTPVMQKAQEQEVENYVEKARHLLQKTDDLDVRKKLIDIFKEGKHSPYLQGGIITSIAALLGGGAINLANNIQLTPYQTNLMMQGILNTIVPAVSARLNGRNWKETIKFTLASLGVGVGIASVMEKEDDIMTHVAKDLTGDGAPIAKLRAARDTEQMKKRERSDGLPMEPKFDYLDEK